MAKPRPTIAIPRYTMHVGPDLIPGRICAIMMHCEVDTVRPLLDGPQVHVEASSCEWRNGVRVETGWTITVTAFIEAEGLKALDEAWERLRADIVAGRRTGRRPTPW